MNDPPRISYWHLWTDELGISHQTRCQLSAFDFKGVGDAAPQWIVPLSGRWWVEAMDGTRSEIGPGELSLGEDQGCGKTADERFGHRSRTIGDVPAVLMTVRLARPPTLRPCHMF